MRSLYNYIEATCGKLREIFNSLLLFFIVLDNPSTSCVKCASRIQIKKYEPMLRYPKNIRHVLLVLLLYFVSTLFPFVSANAAQLRAGVAKVNITSIEGKGMVNDSLYVRVLALDDGITQAVIACLDVRAIGRTGPISNDFLEIVRAQIDKELGIKSANILITATGVGHGDRVRSDVEKLTVMAVKKAWQNMTPVSVGAGTGYEDRIMENRRLRMKDGREWTIRHANPLPPDEEVSGVGPVDPEIGILRLDRKDGSTLAVVYNFACHAYQGVPGKEVTADVPGFASRVIEENLSDGTSAIFLQGFLGDVTTVLYKDVNHPRDAEPLGTMLGLSTLKAVREITCKETGTLKVISETIGLPVRTDIPERLESLQKEQDELLGSLRGTSLNFKTFIPSYIKYNLFQEYPSYYSHRYLYDQMAGRSDMENLDRENRRNMEKYLRNIYAMEKLARIQGNMTILRNQQKLLSESGSEIIDIEIQAIRIGDFVLVTYPGEPAVQIQLNIKKISPHKYTFVSAYSNGCIGYSPTKEQFKGEDLEDTYTVLAPEWQKIYEQKVLEMLRRL